MLFSRSSYQRATGFTLIEVVISMTILMLGGLAIVAAILYTRQALELNKQQMTAANIARQVLESATTNSSIDGISNNVMMRFNDPGLNVPANVQLEYYRLLNNGAVDWATSSSAPLQGAPTYARCTVSWDSLGGSGRRHSVSMSTLVRAGTL